MPSLKHAQKLLFRKVTMQYLITLKLKIFSNNKHMSLPKKILKIENSTQ